MIVRIPVRAVLPKEREKETDFIIIGENRTNTDFSLEDAGRALVYMLSTYLCNGVYSELRKALDELESSTSSKKYEEIMEQFKACAEKFEVK